MSGDVIAGIVLAEDDPEPSLAVFVMMREADHAGWTQDWAILSLSMLTASTRRGRVVGSPLPVMTRRVLIDDTLPPGMVVLRIRAEDVPSARIAPDG